MSELSKKEMQALIEKLQRNLESAEVIMYRDCKDSVFTCEYCDSYGTIDTEDSYICHCDNVYVCSDCWKDKAYKCKTCKDFLCPHCHPKYISQLCNGCHEDFHKKFGRCPVEDEECDECNGDGCEYCLNREKCYID